MDCRPNISNMDCRPNISNMDCRPNISNMDCRPNISRGHALMFRVSKGKVLGVCH